jgi:para-nitrobenzyl esterase
MPRMAEFWGPIALTPTPFSPVVDGDLLPRAPWEALAAGAAHTIDLMVGHTRDEYRLLAARLVDEVTDEQVAATLARLAPTPDGAAEYRTFHPDATLATLHEIVNADWLMRMPSLHLADAHQAGNGRTWTYELCWGPGPNGASHSLDVLLVLGTFDLDDLLDQAASRPEADEEALRLSRRMRTDWVTFAATGSPGWTPYDTTARSTRVYDAEPTTQPYPEERSRRIWRTHRFGVLDLLGSRRRRAGRTCGWSIRTSFTWRG